MKKTLSFVILFSGTLWATTCLVTTITWHIWTPNGVITGITTVVSCDDSGSGGGGGSTGGGGGTSGGGGSSQVSNQVYFLDCLDNVIAYQPSPGSPWPSGVRSFGNGHNGVDLFAESGTVVRSPVSGQIVSLTDGIPRDQNITVSPSFIVGNQIAIEPDGSEEDTPTGTQVVPGAAIRVLVDHLDPGFSSEYNLVRGSRVRKGQIIARSDNTGSSNIGPHLHLEITKSDGTKVDPQELLDCE